MSNPPIPEFNYKVNKDSTGQFREHMARLTHWGNQGWTRVTELEHNLNNLRQIAEYAKTLKAERDRYKEALKRMCRCDEMPEGPYMCEACSALTPVNGS